MDESSYRAEMNEASDVGPFFTFFMHNRTPLPPSEDEETSVVARWLFASSGGRRDNGKHQQVSQLR